MKALVVLLVAVTIHMIGFGAIIPVLPFVLRELGGGAEAQGFLISLFSLAQLLSAPLWGALADRYGKPRVVVVGLLLSAVGNSAAYLSTSLIHLAVARAVAGLGGGTLGALQALIADLSPPERRASSMALFGMAFGVGFILGPILGGAVGMLGERVPFLLSVALSLAASAVVARLPNVKGRLQWSFKIELGLLTAAVLLLNFSFSMFESLLTYYAADVFRMSPDQIGILMFVIGLSAVAGQVAVRRLEGRTRAKTAAAVGLVVMGVGSSLIALRTVELLYLGAVAASMGQLIASANLFAVASEVGGARGLNFGMLQSAGSLGRLVGPATAGLIYTGAGPSYVFLASALVAVAAVPLVLKSLGLKAE
jgi:Arabinose efflux permease